MLRISPAVQLSLGLVFLTISIFMVAQGLGLTPSQDDKNLFARQKISESIALQTTLAIKRDDQYLLVTSFELLSSQTPSILSIGLRKVDGSVVHQTALHGEEWGNALARGSNSTHIRIPIMLGGTPQADLELVFRPLSEVGAGYLGIPRFAWLLLFVSLSGFISFWIYIKRVLHHLDPSSVVPARVKNALNIMTEGVVILDKSGQVVLANESLSNKLGISDKSLAWSKLSNLPWVMGNNASSRRLPWLLAQKDKVKQTDIRMIFPSPNGGKDVVFKVNSVPIMDDKNNSQGTMTSFDDITEIEEKSRQLKRTLSELVAKQKLIEEKNQKLNYLASRDPMTNALNRRSLFSILDAFFGKQHVLGTEYCVVMMDIDHFKNVNDTYGHGVGDSVIKFVCDASVKAIAGQGQLARFGGEEFCIILPDTPMTQALNIAEMCRRKIEEGITENVKVTASFGVASIQYGAGCANDLIQQADEALYESKETGRNRCTPWSPILERADSSKQEAS